MRSFPVLLLMLTGCATTRTSSTLHQGGNQGSISQLVHEIAARHGVEKSLVLGVIQVESSFSPEARSHAGARGLMQLMPRTAASLARRLGYDEYELTDPRFNVDAGTYYLAYLLRLFDGDQSLALAAYNAGPGRVRRWQKKGRSLPAYSRRYVAAVKKAQARFHEHPQRPLPAPPRAKTHDRKGLRELIKRQLYGDRVDEPLVSSRASQRSNSSRKPAGPHAPAATLPALERAAAAR
ncbi:MAG: lytic transglycosylase domain-containing protein [Deltaproteobacteria bacterium]|nr:lytic transglycosylase domain-containing protein [Deltaproteobacteria bacterium]